MLDTESGDLRATGVRVSLTQPAFETLAWSPDSHWLFALRTDGRVVVVDRGTRAVTVLAPFLPPARQLAFAGG